MAEGNFSIHFCQMRSQAKMYSATERAVLGFITADVEAVWFRIIEWVTVCSNQNRKDIGIGRNDDAAKFCVFP